MVMRAVSIPARATLAGSPGSRRLLRLSGDERLVEQIRRGNDAAFEVAFQRYGPAILAFCRHMLGSPEEAEDAVQHTFAAAYRDLERDRDREIALKPWLFAIARNRCVSVLRARREQTIERDELATVGLAEQVERRAELRRLLADLRELPVEQRCALLLAELGDLSHVEVARVLGCDVPRVKALVYRARSRLIARREAREIPCTEIREQLANLRGGSLRRTELRLHLADCSGCRAYRQQVRAQRRMLAAALPIAPTMQLKSGVLAAAGIGAGAAGGGTAGALGGALGGVSGAFGSATVAKVAVVSAIAGGGVVAGEAALTSPQDPAAAPPAAASPASRLPERDSGTVATGVGQGLASREGRPEPGQANSAGEAARSPRKPTKDKTRSGRGDGARVAKPVRAPGRPVRARPHSAPKPHTAPPGHRLPPGSKKAAPTPAQAHPKPAQAHPKPPKPSVAIREPKVPPGLAQRLSTPGPLSNNAKTQHGAKAEAKAP
jgi:RNA polymerase sigma factor (sigma-70 family)